MNTLIKNRRSFMKSPCVSLRRICSEHYRNYQKLVTSSDEISQRRRCQMPNLQFRRLWGGRSNCLLRLLWGQRPSAMLWDRYNSGWGVVLYFLFDYGSDKIAEPKVRGMSKMGGSFKTYKYICKGCCLFKAWDDLYCFWRRWTSLEEV